MEGSGVAELLGLRPCLPSSLALPPFCPPPPSVLPETENHSHRPWIQLQQLQRDKHLCAQG